MKKSALILPLIFLISACDVSLNIGGGTTNLSSSVISYNPSTSSLTPTTNTLLTTSTQVVPESTTSNVTTRDPNIFYTSMMLSSDYFDSSNKYLKDYDTGNYGSLSLGGSKFNYYRAYRNGSDELMDLIPYVGTQNDGSLPGAFYNSTAVYDIISI